jgi:hypothetical protein
MDGYPCEFGFNPPGGLRHHLETAGKQQKAGSIQATSRFNPLN